jgi:hypothetical protein
MKSKRKKSSDVYDVRLRARAVGHLVNAGRKRDGSTDKRFEMAAFMQVFHPEFTGEKLQRLLEG